MIYFTSYAEEKFSILNSHGVFIRKEQVIDTLTAPEEKGRLGVYCTVQKDNIKSSVSKRSDDEESHNFLSDMNYDLEANILSWEIGHGKIARVKEIGNFIVHLSPAGKPVLIEILNASRFKTKLAKLETIKQVSEAFGN